MKEIHDIYPQKTMRSMNEAYSILKNTELTVFDDSDFYSIGDEASVRSFSDQASLRSFDDQSSLRSFEDQSNLLSFGDHSTSSSSIGASSDVSNDEDSDGQRSRQLSGDSTISESQSCYLLSVNRNKSLNSNLSIGDRLNIKSLEDRLNIKSFGKRFNHPPTVSDDEDTMVCDEGNVDEDTVVDEDDDDEPIYDTIDYLDHYMKRIQKRMVDLQSLLVKYDTMIRAKELAFKHAVSGIHKDAKEKIEAITEEELKLIDAVTTQYERQSGRAENEREKICKQMQTIKDYMQEGDHCDKRLENCDNMTQNENNLTLNSESVGDNLTLNSESVGDNLTQNSETVEDNLTQSSESVGDNLTQNSDSVGYVEVTTQDKSDNLPKEAENFDKSDEKLSLCPTEDIIKNDESSFTGCETLSQLSDTYSGISDTDSTHGTEFSEVDNSDFIFEENKLHSIVDELDALVKELNDNIVTDRVIIRYIPNISSNLSLGYIQECSINEDYNRVTKKRAVSFRLETPRVKIQKRAFSDMDISKLGLTEEDETKFSDDESIVDEKQYENVEKVLDTNEKEEQTENENIYINVPNAKTYKQLLYKITNDKKCSPHVSHPVDATFLPNGHILVAEKGSRQLKEFDDNGKTVQIFQTHTLSPRGVCMTQEGYVAVTDKTERNIQVFTRGATLVCKFATGYFRDLSMIATLSDDTYVVNEHLGPWQQYIFKYNAMTGVMTRLGYNKSGHYVTNHPECIAVDADDNIAITDSGNHCVWMVDKNGKLKFRFGRQGHKDGDFNYPKGICIDENGGYLIADCANHRVCRFDNQGRFLETVLDAKDGLEYPQVVKMSPSNKLAVIQAFSVLLFQL